MLDLYLRQSIDNILVFLEIVHVKFFAISVLSYYLFPHNSVNS
ncbi:hypothetical protein T4D_16456 [Trichinella pseudospiralis]|uniref:Uncharacterized protein n=1 Tax=Trichinella pseudospiralis TaxID=6337 RepID=A0A0V1DPP6_TRIPS|nr:hypothetical protein T4D_16456 [Trichinella pseudospiralis]